MQRLPSIENKTSMELSGCWVAEKCVGAHNVVPAPGNIEHQMGFFPMVCFAQPACLCTPLPPVPLLHSAVVPPTLDLTPNLSTIPIALLAITLQCSAATTRSQPSTKHRGWPSFFHFSGLNTRQTKNAVIALAQWMGLSADLVYNVSCSSVVHPVSCSLHDIPRIQKRANSCRCVGNQTEMNDLDSGI